MALDMKEVMVGQSEEQMKAARAHMLWHLSRLASFAATDMDFGQSWDDELREVVRWRAAWKSAKLDNFKWRFQDGREGTAG